MLTDLSLTTVMFSVAFAAGVLLIIFMTWRNAQPTGTIGQLLHRTDKVPYHGEIDPRRFSDRDRD
ncbi:MAG TPA: hypothetical protein VFZ36_02035 [Vicinamibacterales bacterium]